MRRLVALAVFTLTLAVGGSAAAKLADKTDSKNWKSTTSTNEYNLLEGVALNAASASDRTITLNTKGFWAKLRVSVFFTYTAATTVDAVFTCAYDGVNYAQITSRSISGGTATVSKLTDSHPVSADSDFQLEYDVKGCEFVKVLFSGTGAGGSDTVDVQATTIAGA